MPTLFSILMAFLASPAHRLIILIPFLFWFNAALSFDLQFLCGSSFLHAIRYPSSFLVVSAFSFDLGICNYVWEYSSTFKHWIFVLFNSFTLDLVVIVWAVKKVIKLWSMGSKFHLSSNCYWINMEKKIYMKIIDCFSLCYQFVVIYLTTICIYVCMFEFIYLTSRHIYGQVLGCHKLTIIFWN